MKKIYHFLMLLMLSILLVACGSSESGSKKEDKKTEESTKKSKKKKKSKKDKKSKDKDKDQSDEVDETDETEEEETKKEKETEAKKQKSNSKSERPMTLESYTAIDNEKCSITINSIEEDKWSGGYDINVLLENKSADVNYNFTLEAAVVNGVQVEPSLYSNVLAGKKASAKIGIRDLTDYGITECTDIELFFKVVDSDDFGAEDILNEAIHVYPYGQENATQFTREAKATDQVLVDNEYVTITYIGSRQDDIYGFILDTYIVNKTDKELSIRADAFSIDSYMADASYYVDIKPGKSMFEKMYWNDYIIKQIGVDISNIKNIEGTIKVRDGAYKELSSDAVKITP